MKEFIPDRSRLHPSGYMKEISQQMEDDLKYYQDKNGQGLDREKVEEVCCSLCNTPKPDVSHAIFFKLLFPYFRCPLCNLIYPSPRPKKEYIDRQYLRGRFAKIFHKLYLPTAEYRMSTIFRERVENIILPRVKRGRLLDIGCSSGHFLKVAEAYGFKVYGIEPNQEMVDFATNELKLPNIINGVFQGNEYPREYFDIVTLWDVLEHVLNPNQVLGSVLKVLKPGAWVFAYTENVESFNVFITGSDSEIFAPDVHLRHYSPKTFRREFEQAGFLVKEVMTKGIDIQHIEATIELNPDKYSPELQTFLKHSDELQDAINASEKGDNLRLFAQKAGAR